MRPALIRLIWPIWPIWLCALAAAACGYSSGTGLGDQGIRRVHVTAVANETYRQRLEVELSAAVSRELAVSSDLWPSPRDQADAILEIRIVEEHERTLVSGDRTSPVVEGAQAVNLQVRLVDCRTGRAVIDRRIADRAEFRTPIGEDLTSARQELVEDLARKIVLALETGF